MGWEGAVRFLVVKLIHSLHNGSLKVGGHLSTPINDGNTCYTDTYTRTVPIVTCSVMK